MTQGMINILHCLMGYQGLTLKIGPRPMFPATTKSEQSAARELEKHGLVIVAESSRWPGVLEVRKAYEK